MEEKKFTQDVILKILRTPDGETCGKENRYLIWRMLGSLINRQTPTEHSGHTTIVRNAVGLNKWDARPMTKLYQDSITFRHNTLTVGQARWVGNVIRKYIRQLCEIAGTPYEKKQQDQVAKSPVEVPTGRITKAEPEMQFPKQRVLFQHAPTDPADYLSASELKRRRRG